jgi:hypothetical protein
LTVYDEEHVITYLRLLDADAGGADWRQVARIVLHLDPEHEPDRARRAFDVGFFLVYEGSLFERRDGLERSLT